MVGRFQQKAGGPVSITQLMRVCIAGGDAPVPEVLVGGDGMKAVEEPQPGTGATDCELLLAAGTMRESFFAVLVIPCALCRPRLGGDPGNTNPEQALAAALSSCHMMTFLALAATAKWPVASFHDRAVAHLGKNAQGRMSVTRVDLHPVVRFDTGFSVDATELEQMQHRAHHYCFIANTLADSVEINVL
jgi:organic hydroperoxide reductase OsmC/OhrA